MANFPTTLDSFTDPASTNFLNSPSHSNNHAVENDAIVALEAKVGINNSADITSLDYKVSHISTDGWNAVTDAWTYASATTITVPSGAASIYAIGQKIRIKQGGGYLYFYIIAVADTLLTITGGSDYTLANAVITNIAYAHSESPVGFPGWFNYTTTWGGFSVNPSETFKFKIINRQVFIYYYSGGSLPVDGTSNDVTTTFTLPIASLNTLYNAANCNVKDSNTLQANPGFIQLAAGSLTATVGKSFASGQWTNSGTKNFYAPIFSYEI